ncbi:MAG: toxic anion resistance protein, partial [Candidatus Riflebacteria bacterium]|nr:toxic anion resistance protein [Candidatus Riflebacteria bacterium]
QIEINNIETITGFCAEAAEEISRASDSVLNNVSLPQLNESSDLLVSLNKVMEQFLPEELTPKPESFWDKIVNFFKGGLKKQLDNILRKYETFGGEVDKIYTQLKKYETDIKLANRQQEELYQANVSYYKDLVKYIVAGEAASEELAKIIQDTQAEYSRTNDNEMMLRLNDYNKAKEMLDQRVDDLRKAEMVALQSLPTIKNQQYNNMNLVRKINSAFIITLPIFKTNLAQAIQIKRQKLQADAIAALDEKTNQLLVQNAKNVATQSKQIAKMASGSSIKIETLEKSWREIVNGIQETQRIQEAAKRQREDDKKRLESIKDDFKKLFGSPNGHR